MVKKFTVLEKEIYESLKNKSKDFHKPARIKSMNFYKNPMAIQGIKAAFAYNTIKDRAEEGINLEERNSVLIIKTNLTAKNINEIAKTHPEHCMRASELLKDPNYKAGITSIAIPSNIDIPDWIIPFINYTDIIQSNLRNFPLEELGISKMDSKNVTHTNILQF